MKKYRCAFLLGLETSMEYRMDFLLSMISAFFPIVIQIYLWTAIYGNANGDISNGYTYNQMILYTLTANIVSKFVFTGFEYEINEDIKNGGLNKYIVKPVNYLLYRIYAFLGSKVPSMIILIIILTAVLMVAGPLLQVTFPIYRILLFVISLLAAIILNFLLYFCISMLGFWITEISRLFGTIYILLVVLSGGVFPLDVFGDTVSKITAFLPFKYTTQFCVDILCGRLIPYEIYTGFIHQLLWAGVFGILSVLMWNKGLRRYVAIGG